MDVKDLIASLSTTNVELGTLRADKATLEATVANLTNAKDTAEAEVTRLKAELTEAKTAKETAEAELATATADAPEGSAEEVKAVKEFVEAHFDAAVTASNKTDVKADTLAAKLAFIQEEGVKLHTLVNAGTNGVSNGVEGKETELDASLTAILKTNKKGDK